jgi:hypothetical protein
VALLLPPLAGGSLGFPPFHLARESQRGPPDVVVVPARLDSYVDVDATGSRGLGEAAQSVLLQDLPDAHRHLADRVPSHPRRGVEVHAQLVRAVEVGSPDRVGVEIDHSEVDRPDQVGGVVDDQLGCRAPAREGECRGLEPLGRPLGHALLEEELAAGAVDEALHRPRPLPQLDNRRFFYCEVVLGDVELGVARLGEEHLVRVGEPDLAAGRLDRRVVALGHRVD